MGTIALPLASHCPSYTGPVFVKYPANFYLKNIEKMGAVEAFLYTFLTCFSRIETFSPNLDSIAVSLLQ